MNIIKNAINLYNKYVTDFINNSSTKGNYKIKDNKFKTQVLVTGIKIDKSSYAFISTMLEPLTSTFFPEAIYSTVVFNISAN